jgi:hypothetical protein
MELVYKSLKLFSYNSYLYYSTAIESHMKAAEEIAKNRWQPAWRWQEMGIFLLGLELAKASQVPLHLFFASKQDTFSESYVEFGDERRCISAFFRC